MNKIKVTLAAIGMVATANMAVADTSVSVPKQNVATISTQAPASLALLGGVGATQVALLVAAAVVVGVVASSR